MEEKAGKLTVFQKLQPADWRKGQIRQGSSPVATGKSTYSNIDNSPVTLCYAGGGGHGGYLETDIPEVFLGAGEGDLGKEKNLKSQKDGDSHLKK